MEVQTKKTETFKPMFLHHNKERYNDSVKRYSRNLSLLNNLIQEVEKVLDRKLTDEEKHSIAKGSTFFLDELKSKFPFPKSTDEFNYTAMGVDIKALIEKKEAYKGAKHVYELQEGIFVESDEYIESLSKAADIYTTNEKQNQMVKALQKMLEAYEVLIPFSNCSSFLGHGKQEVDRYITVNGGKLEINHHRVLEK